MVSFKKHIAELEPYLPPSHRTSDRKKKRLYMNENLFGCAPAVISVLKNIGPDEILYYPAGGSAALKEAISSSILVGTDRVVVGSGESEILKQIFHAFLSAGDKVLLCKHSWSYFPHLCKINNAKIVNFSMRMDERHFFFDVEHIIKESKKHVPKLIVLVSPNMPTGNLLARSALEKILRSSKRSLVLLDEAYFGFSENDSRADAELQKLLARHDNLIICRTFSKYYGLASLRIGYALCSRKIAEYLEKSSPLFGIPFPVQLAAIRALKSKAYYHNLRRAVVASRDTFIREVNSTTGYKAYASDANFMLLRAGKDAPALERHLYEGGFIVRNCAPYDLHDFIRITVAPADVMKALLRAIRNFRRPLKSA